MRNARNDLAYYLGQRFGMGFKFYKEREYFWCFDIEPPTGQTLSFITDFTVLNYKKKSLWVERVFEVLKEHAPHLLAHVKQYEAESWERRPVAAEIYGIPKPEECEMSTQTETKTEGKPALNRYKFRVVETFEIYVDAADEEAAKAFIEEGVPQMQHAAFQCHDREYTVKECKPLEEDKSCGKLYATEAEARRARHLDSLKYFVRKRKQYEHKGQVIPKYWKQFQYWDARLTKGANRFARDYGYLPSFISDHLR